MEVTMARSSVLGYLDVVLFEDGRHDAEGGQRESGRGGHVQSGTGQGCLLPRVGDADEDSLPARGQLHFGPHMVGVHVRKWVILVQAVAWGRLGLLLLTTYIQNYSHAYCHY